MEFFGKVVLMPAVLFTFLAVFPQGLHYDTRVGYCIFFSILAILIFFRELTGFKNGFNQAIYCIRGKIENPASFDVTNTEILAYNITCFGKFSYSKSHYHNWKRANEKKVIAEGMVEVPVDSGGPLLLPSRASCAATVTDTGTGMNTAQTVPNHLRNRFPGVDPVNPPFPTSRGSVEMPNVHNGAGAGMPIDETNSDDEDTSTVNALHRSAGYEL